MVKLYDIRTGASTATHVTVQHLQSLWERAITQAMISPGKEPVGGDLLDDLDKGALGKLFKAMIDTEAVVLHLPERLLDVSARRLRDFVLACIADIDEATPDDQIAVAALYLPLLDTIGLMLDSVAIDYHLSGKVDKLGKPGNPTSVASVITAEGLTIVANEPDLQMDRGRKIDESLRELVSKSRKYAFPDLRLAEQTTMSLGVFRAHSYYSKQVKNWSKTLAKPTLNPSFTRGNLANHYLQLQKEKQIHAELRLIDLLAEGLLTRPPLGLVYIGSSLLCCNDCARAIDFFNTYVSDADGLGMRILTRGTHPGCYRDSWEVPYFIERHKEAFLGAYPNFMTRPANGEAAVFSRI